MATSTSKLLIYNNNDSLKATAVTVAAAYGSRLQASSYGKNVATIDASSHSKVINITGNTQNNVIVCGSGNDTLDGGKGNDVLTGGKGKDIFLYSSGGGNDTITDYTAGQDTIKISSGSISGYSDSGNDVILTVGAGTLKIQGGKNNAITIKDSQNKIVVYKDGVIYNNTNIANATSATITSNYENESIVANTAMITLNASANTNDIEIIGNKKNNSILGGSGDDILSGGAGSDTLTGGKGNDTFIYEAGNDVIADYTENEDTIKISAGVEITSYTVSGKDLVLKTNNKGSIRIKNGKTQAIKISDGDNSIIYQNGAIYDNEDISVAESVTITSNYGKEFNASDSSIATINASAKSVAMKISGNNENNYIIGTKKNDTITATAGENTIVAGMGNDLLIGGSSHDIFYYTKGDGNDTIRDYTKGQDIIQIAGSDSVSYSTVNNNAVFKVGTGKLTLENAANMAITLVGADSIASIYGDGEVSTKPWTGFGDTSAPETVYITLPAETITVGGGETVTVYDTVTVTLPAETVNVTLPPVTETVKVEVTLPAETIYSSGKNINGNSKAETLYGTTGNDTVTLGGGKDVYIYEGGLDVITDYTEGNDKISIGANSVNDYGVIGNDGIFFVGNGALKVVGAKDKKVTIISGSNENEYDLTVTSTNPSVPSGATVTLDSNFTGNFSLTSYNATSEISAQHIDASAVTNSITIYGDEKANVIKAGKAGGNIYAGEGNDTIYCGNGNDTIRFYQYDGNETVYNIRDNDQIILNNCTAQNVSVKGNDVVITTSSNETITLKDGTGKRIFITGQNWQTYSATSASVSENIWFLEDDNNFVGSEIDSVIDEDKSVTNLNFNNETENIFAQEDSLIAYNPDDDK